MADIPMPIEAARLKLRSSCHGHPSSSREASPQGTGEQEGILENSPILRGCPLNSSPRHLAASSFALVEHEDDLYWPATRLPPCSEIPPQEVPLLAEDETDVGRSEEQPCQQAEQW